MAGRRSVAVGVAIATAVAAAAHAQVALPADSVPSYRIDGRVSPETGRLAGAVSVRFPPGAAGAEHRLLLGRSYRITALTGEGALVSAVEADKPIPGIRLITVRTTGSAGPLVRIEYEGPVFSLVKPPLNVVSPSLVELSVDSFWIPYSADLGAPFTATALIRGIPASAVVVANVPHRMTPDGLRLDASTPTNDLAFVAAPGLRTAGGDRFQLFAADPESPLASYYGMHGAAAIRFLEGLLGPMPGRTATVAVVRRESGSGYARPGYVVVTETSGSAPGAGQAKFIAHEFAHLWFSRARPTGEAYWLVETPAEYLGLRYAGEALGAAALEGLLDPIRQRAATAPPLLGRGRPGDAALYAKGPLLFFELEREIGRDRFDSLLRQLADEPRHDTGVFLTILRRVAGADVADRFEARLRA